MYPISDKQRNFIRTLLDERQLPDAELTQLVQALEASDAHEQFRLSSKEASEHITRLLAAPRKPQQEQSSALSQIPAGRYAIENADGELRFYQLWTSKDGSRRNLYVMFGPSEAKLYRNAQEVICQKILEAGVRECAIRFGHEIGSCSNCGRRLTNRISRELGIGPICGGRMFGGDWKSEVNEARDRIVARGLDPDEELSEETVNS